MSIPTQPGLYVHEDEAEIVQEVMRWRLYSLTLRDGWFHGDERVDESEVPDGLIRLVPEVPTEWEYGWFCEWADGSGTARLLMGSETWGPNGRVFRARRRGATQPGEWKPIDDESVPEGKK